MIFRHPTAADYPAMQKLWQDTFGDEASFPAAFYARKCDPELCMIAEHNSLCAMMHTVYFPVFFAGKTWKGAYLYAVATALPQRGHGLCHTLHARLCRELTEKKYDFLFTIPANASLFAFYGAMGYQATLNAYSRVALPEDAQAVTTEEAYLFYQKHFKNGVLLDDDAFALTYSDRKMFLSQDSLWALEDEKYFDVMGVSGASSPSGMVKQLHSGLGKFGFSLPFLMN